MKKIKIVIFLAITIFVFLPKQVFGLAGLGEQDFEYNYSSKILIEFNDPSDACAPEYNPNQQCIELYPAEKNQFGTHPKFYNLGVLSEVNLPQINEPTHIIGKSYRDGKWLIYDFENYKVIFSDSNYDTVEQQWEKLGNSKPKFVDMSNYSKYFHTLAADSKKENDEMERFALVMILAGLGGIFIPIAAILGIGYLVKKFLDRNKSRRSN